MNKKATAPMISTENRPENLPLTDPRRKLSKEEWKSMTKEQKKERRANRKAAKGPAKQGFVRLTLRISKRFSRLAKSFENDVILGRRLQEISVEAKNLADDIDELPDTWVPAGKKANNYFEKGQRVVMLEGPEKASAEEALGEEIGEMEVISFTPKKVVVKTVKGNIRMFLPPKQLKAVTA